MGAYFDPISERHNISIIILSAGLSQRMSQDFKLLLPYGHHTIIEEVLVQTMALYCAEVIVVSGHQYERLSVQIEGNREIKEEGCLKIIHNPDFKNGMTSSIQAGVKAACKDTIAYMICQGDQPFIQTNDYSKIVNAFLTYYVNQPLILRPTFNHQNGHPVLFSHHFKEQILFHQEKEGCKKIVADNKHFLKTVSMDNDAVLRDVDTDEDYAHMVK